MGDDRGASSSAQPTVDVLEVGTRLLQPILEPRLRTLERPELDAAVVLRGGDDPAA